MSEFSPWPSYTREEADAVAEVLLSNKVNQWTGEVVNRFEAAFAEFCDTEYAVAYSNGTTALEGALKALEIGAGDEVIVTPRSFVASATAILTVGATPVFADVDSDSQLITPETVGPLIRQRTRAILCVHLAGWPCDMDGFRDLVAGRGITLIEDCAQAHGARYKGHPVGGLGDIAAWSFCQDKIMTTGGEGGMITTNDESLFRKAWSYKDHGKSYEAVFEKQHPPGFRWLHESTGTNARMTAMQAAIGLIQLERMPFWHASRTTHADTLMDAARELECLRVPEIPLTITHAWYRCCVFLESDDVSLRDRLLGEITQLGVPAFSGSCSEIYLERAILNAGIEIDPLPQARILGNTSLTFLVHPTLTQQEIERTCEALREVCAEGCVR